MRICFFNYHYDLEGTSRGAAAQIRSIAQGLENLGHQVNLHFRAAQRQGQESTYGGLKRFGLLRRYGHVPRLLLRNVVFFRQECRILDAFRPDVLMAVHHYGNLSALLAAKRRNIPFVLFSETPMEYEYSLFYTQYHPYPAMGRWIEGMNVRGADQVLCISEILKGYLMRYGAAATRLHVVPNGVDHRLFYPRQPDSELVSRLALQDKQVIGFVGTFQFFSDVKQFMAVVHAVCTTHPQAVFLFVGSGETREEIRRAATACGLSDRLVFTGPIPHHEIPRYLSVMDVVLCPYRGDYLFYGSPLKPLEYMAAGKATLCTAVGQIKELIHDGCNGMLFPWDDERILLEKLLLLLRDASLRQSLGAMARKTIESQWTWELQVSRMERVLKMAAGRS